MNNRPAVFIGNEPDRVSLYRVSDSLTTILGMDTGAHVSTETVYSNFLEERTAGEGITVSGVLTVQDGITWERGGATIKEVYRLTEDNVAWSSMPANSSATQTFSVPGAFPGDTVSVGVLGGGPGSGIAWNAWVSDDDTLALQIHNITGSTIAPATRNWRFNIWSAA